MKKVLLLIILWVGVCPPCMAEQVTVTAENANVRFVFTVVVSCNASACTYRSNTFNPATFTAHEHDKRSRLNKEAYADMLSGNGTLYTSFHKCLDKHMERIGELLADFSTRKAKGLLADGEEAGYTASINGELDAICGWLETVYDWMKSEHRHYCR